MNIESDIAVDNCWVAPAAAPASDADIRQITDSCPGWLSVLKLFAPIRVLCTRLKQCKDRWRWWFIFRLQHLAWKCRNMQVIRKKYVSLKFSKERIVTYYFMIYTQQYTACRCTKLRVITNKILALRHYFTLLRNLIVSILLFSKQFRRNSSGAFTSYKNK